MVRKGRYTPINEEIKGYITTFFWCWFISLIIIVVFAGLTWYSFFGGTVLALIPATILFIVLLKLTGVKSEFGG